MMLANRSKELLLLLCFAFFLPATAEATKFWKNSVTTGNWSTGGNWSAVSAAGADNGGVPVAGESVNIANADGIARTVIYDYSGLPIVLNTLAVDLTGPGSSATTLSMTSADTLSTNSATIGLSGRAVVDQTAGTHSISTDLILASAAGSQATYSVSSAGVLAITGIQYVGNSGSGALNVAAGGHASNADAHVGFLAGASGSATIDGTGSQWTNSSVLSVGTFGSGSMNIMNGGYVSSVNGRVGRELGSLGVVVIDGVGSEWHMTGDLSVGRLGGGNTSTLTIQNDGRVYAGLTLSINSTSNVNLAGGTLRFNSISGLNRLNYTAGTIQLAGDRHFASDSTITTLYGSTPNIVSGKGLSIEGQGSIGSGANPVESVLVSGGRLAVNTLRVGGDGSGVLQITNGGALEQQGAGAALYVGGNAVPQTGSVLVSGPNSSINSEGGIYVGLLTAGGSMTVTNGAVVNSSDSGIAGPLNTSFVTVTGPGSAWNLPNASLSIGGSAFGYGTLNVDSGATVFVGAQLKISPNNDSAVNVAGGTLRFDTIGGTKGVNGINYTSGTIQLAGDRDIGTDAAIQVLFGASPSIAVGKGLTVEGTATISSNMTLQGGTLIASAIDGPAMLNFLSGTLSITGAAGLTIDGGSPLGNAITLGAGQNLNVTDLLHIGPGGRLTNAANRVVPGNVEVDAGGRWTVTDGVQSVGAGLLNSGTLALIDTTVEGPVTTTAGSVVNVVGDVTFNQPFAGSGQFFGSGTATFNGGFSPGNSPAAVAFEGSVALGAANTLTIEIGGTNRGSQFDAILADGNLNLDGSLAITLVDGFNPVSGQAFDILDWGNLVGTFDTVNLPVLGTGLNWDTTQLYTTGVLSVVSVGVPGDYNNNGVVDAADYVLWRNGGPLANEVDTPGVVNVADYSAWRARFGNTSGSGASNESELSLSAVPEPNVTLVFLLGWASSMAILRSRTAVAANHQSKLPKCSDV